MLKKHFLKFNSAYNFMFNNPLRASLALIFGILVFNATAQDFEVAPVKLNFECEPGQIQTKTLTIRNHSNTKQQFALIISDLKLDTNIKSTIQRSCKDWITLSPSFFEINPNEKTEVKVVMQVPPGESSTRGAMIYVSSTEEQTALGADKQMNSALKVRPRIGVKVVQSPTSNKNYRGSVSNLKESTKANDTLRTFEVTVSNIGDKMLEGKVYLVLSNLETAKEIKELPKKVSLFPGISKSMKLIMPKNCPPGKYSVAAILDYGYNSSLEAVQMNIEVK